MAGEERRDSHSPRPRRRAGGGDRPFCEVVALKEAAEEWGVADATIRQYILKGKFRPGEARKSGGTWLVKRSAMRRVFGLPRR
ncbi:MAG: helix-turn-helix domain-containing protein [Bacillota bacterium]